MKKLLPLTIIIILLTSSNGMSLTGTPFYVPDYYRQSDFLSSAPGVSGGATGAFFNPAVLGMIKGSEVQFFWSDFEKEGLNNTNWALMFAEKGFGFNMQRWNYGQVEGSNIVRKTLTDYNLSLGGGNRESSFGMGYSWSKGDNSITHPRDNTLSMGMLNRPCRHVSFGAVGHWALGEHDARGVIDLGVRPLGTQFLTIFGDATLQSNQSLKHAEWGAGLAFEPQPGISFHGKVFHGGAFNVGMSISLGGGGFQSISHYDTDSEQLYNTYGVRLGYPTTNIVTKLAMKDKAILRLDLNNRIRYQRYKLFDYKGHTLTELLKLLDKVENDPRMSGVAIKMTEDMYGSWEVLWEIREKILDVRSAGKTVFVYFERGGKASYYLASAADKVMADPEAMVEMMGFNMGRTFYVNMLEKLGLGVDEWRFFRYKSAFEALSREDMSDADKEQRMDLIDGFYEIWRADICESRGISHEEFDHVVNEMGFLTADSMIAYNLVDTLGRWPDMKEWIEEVTGEKKMMLNKTTIALLQEEDDEWGIPPQIAIIYAIGGTSMNSGINARRLEKTIQQARNNKKIKAVVFRADSPGGDAMASDIVAVELKKTAEDKPVIVSQGWVAASGGYWISMYGDKIVASPWTITGSIGVIGGWIWDEGMGDKLGLTYDNVQRGEHADLGGGFSLPLLGVTVPKRNLTPMERTYVENMFMSLYSTFVKKVAEGRGITEEEVREIGEGHVYTGTRGKELKLVDELGGLERAIELALEAANIPEDRHYEIVEMPQKGLFNPGMFARRMFGIKINPWEIDDETLEMQYMRMMMASQGRPLVLLSPDMIPQ